MQNACCKILHHPNRESSAGREWSNTMPFSITSARRALRSRENGVIQGDNKTSDERWLATSWSETTTMKRYFWKAQVLASVRSETLIASLIVSLDATATVPVWSLRWSWLRNNNNNAVTWLADDYTIHVALSLLPDTTDHLIVCSGIIVPSGRRVHEVMLMLPGCSLGFWLGNLNWLSWRDILSLLGALH